MQLLFGLRLLVRIYCRLSKVADKVQNKFRTAVWKFIMGSIKTKFTTDEIYPKKHHILLNYALWNPTQNLIGVIGRAYNCKCEDLKTSSLMV